ncbi:transposase [Spirosoma profusum]|uniref:transposase n=1 Tax=Spirosoma profusum TaxID=2771354 RepID=UPI001CC2643A|nr:transposase [Spirosoma profusum]
MNTPKTAMAQLAIPRLIQLYSAPAARFKFMLIGYLENIISDRELIEHCALRMDMLYFLGYNIDEPLPWHSTLSRTRQLYPEALFELLFDKVFSLCVANNIVAGRRVAIDRYGGPFGPCQSERVDGNALRKTTPATWTQVTNPS